MEVVFWGDFDAFCGNPGASAAKISPVANFDSVKLRFGAVSASDAPPILFVRDSVLANCRPQIAELEKQYPNLRAVLVYGDTDMTKVWDLLEACPSIAHVMPLRSANSSGRVMDLLADRPRRFLPQDLGECKEMAFQNSTERYGAYKTLGEYVAGLKCFADFTTIAVTAASELLTNAFYNAKRDLQSGRAVCSDRKTEVKLDDKESIQFSYGREDKYLWLVVRDGFGTMDRATLVRAIGRAARERSPLTNTGGAGLGLNMLFSWATELNVWMQPGLSTAMACKLLLTPRNSLFEAEPSALHIVSTDASW